MAKDDDYIPDSATLEGLAEMGIRSARTKPSRLDSMPSTAAGLPSLRVRDVPQLEDTTTNGFVIASNVLADKDRNRRSDQTVFKAPTAGDSTVAHEIEHLLARQNLGFAQLTREKFNELLGNGAKQSQFLNALVEAAPYLESKYGIKNAYTNPKFIRSQGDVGLYEILATLAGAESARNVDLTKDPVLRKTLFKDKDVRETYNAVTGLRQTRLDPRDLPPYTRQPEKDESVGAVGKLKKLIGFANGGHVPSAGNKKLI